MKELSTKEARCANTGTSDSKKLHINFNTIHEHKDGVCVFGCPMIPTPKAMRESMLVHRFAPLAYIHAESIQGQIGETAGKTRLEGGQS